MSDFFNKNKYLVKQSAISEDAARIIGNSLLISESKDEMTIDEAQVVGASSAHGLSIMESVMLSVHPIIESSTDLKLKPTYSFCRIYRKGDDLKPHKDRQSCEISATLTLNYKSEDLWPIFVETEDGSPKGIELDTGDLMIYRGCDIQHWREEFKGDLWMQVFIHYVDMNGPYYPEYAFDKRGGRVPGLYNFILENM